MGRRTLAKCVAAVAASAVIASLSPVAAHARSSAPSTTTFYNYRLFAAEGRPAHVWYLKLGPNRAIVEKLDLHLQANSVPLDMVYRRLLYLHGSPSGNQIWLRNRAGKVHLLGPGDDAVFTPGHTGVLITRRDQGLYVYKRATGVLTQIYAAPTDYSISGAAYSPDHKSIWINLDGVHDLKLVTLSIASRKVVEHPLFAPGVGGDPVCQSIQMLPGGTTFATPCWGTVGNDDPAKDHWGNALVVARLSDGKILRRVVGPVDPATGSPEPITRVDCCLDPHHVLIQLVYGIAQLDLRNDAMAYIRGGARFFWTVTEPN